MLRLNSSNMKKLVSILLFVGALFLFFPSKSRAYTDDYIENFNSDITLNQDASIDIIETIDYHFVTYEHGIYREIPTQYKTLGAFTRPTILELLDLYYYPTENSSDIHKDYERSLRNGYTIFKIGNEDETIIGDYTYILKYKLVYAENYFNDHDELYLNITGNGWEVPILSVNSTVKVPGEITKKTCYAGAIDSTQSNCIMTDLTAQSFNVSAEKLNIYDGVTIVVAMPKNTIANTTQQQKIEFVLSNLGFGLPLLGIVLAIFLIKKFNTNKKLTIIPNYNAPKNVNPILGGYLYKKNLPNSVISAQLIQLAINGYIKIKQLSKRDYELIKTPKGEPSDPEEKSLYNGIFKSKDSFKIKDLQSDFFNTVAKLRLSLEKRLTVEDYFSTYKKSVRSRIIMIGGIVAVISMFLIRPLYLYAAMSWFWGILLTSLVVIVAGLSIDKRSEKGNVLFYDLEGLKMYINTAEKHRIEFHNDPQKYNGVFESLLPYAMIFGLEKKWAKEFEDIYIQQPDWYEGNLNTFNSYIFLNSLSQINKQIAIHSNPQNSAHGFSSSHGGFGGSGFSGGSVGGGFGGGGGGSW